MDEYAIIVAGGTGTRMKSKVSKQFLLLDKKPVLMHTLEAFHAYSDTLTIVVVLPESEMEYWKQLCNKHHFSISHQLVSGGRSRFQSVKNGLKKVPANSVVAIHDGVRPLIHKEIIGASFQIAKIHGSAVAAVRLKESIRQADQDTTKAVDRSKYRIIQTPQTFKSDIILQAYNLDEQPDMTDDASVAEAAGHKISLFEGSYENIKITTPEDLWIAGAIIRYRKKAQ
ncbi:MAG TPA: 2-C-methyl-D-erythritol 4-phosphate cytidylyltransferase [Cytophagales bacterium]|jgi:2-C-methyl-D-erythritol 4-phosphate cytidylyltransferase|nr:2-C-methyl-D-erythritol 4-phosphate cytidylyltransferase [Cytophagales bacterium]